MPDAGVQAASLVRTVALGGNRTAVDAILAGDLLYVGTQQGTIDVLSLADPESPVPGAGATGAVPPLVTTADLAIVTLASGRGAATWLTGATDVQLSADQVRAAIAEHRELTARCLAGALEAAPGFIDAAYLVARLAVKAGLLPAARAVRRPRAAVRRPRPRRRTTRRSDRSACVSCPERGPARRLFRLSPASRRSARLLLVEHLVEGLRAEHSLAPPLDISHVCRLDASDGDRRQLAEPGAQQP